MPCESFEIDIRQERFFSHENEYRRLENLYAEDEDKNFGVQSYERPVYVSEEKINILDIILFSGRRWTTYLW